MKKYLVIAIALFSFANLGFADEKTFCDTYDSKITNMGAMTTNDDSYAGFPKRLSTQEFNKMPKVANDYCPSCTLANKKDCEAVPCQKYNIMPGTVYQGVQSKDDPWMKIANAEALKSVQNGGGPFGAVILQIDDATGKVIRYWANHNHVAEWTDPTAHAEVTTIRAATKELGVLNLGHINKKDAKLPQPGEWSHCVIYSSAEPCPMCLAAIYWTGIPDLAFAATRFDAAVKGVDFSDEMIYEEIARPYVKRKHMHVVHSNSSTGLDAFNYYKRNNVARYGVGT